MSDVLRVGANLMWLVPGVVGGSESYATGLLGAASKIGDVELTAFALPAFVQHYPSLASELRTVAASLPPGRHVVRRVLTENSWLPTQLRARKFDVVHHLGGIVPRTPLPSVVTLHDLQYLAYPEYFSSTKRRYLAATQGRSLQRARVVTAISEFTRAQAIERFGLDADKVTVVPPVVRTLTAPDDAARRATRDALSLHGSFVLYPAAMYPHKNHLVLVRAFAQVCRDFDVTLALTGASGAGAWGSAHSTQAQIHALASSLGIADRVRLLGYVSDAQLVALYAEAALLAFPSRFEGFGLPVVEAMALGCPVVASNATTLPALVGDAGVLVDPDDVEGWSSAIAKLLADDAERGRLSAAGMQRAQGRDPADSVVPLIEAYRKAAS